MLSRRALSSVMVTSALLALTGCESKQTAGEDVGAVDDALAALGSAIDQLSASVSNFNDDDWKDVVPNVQAGATDVVDAFERLRKAMGIAP